MPPIILSSADAGSGLVLLVVSASPGRRLQVIFPSSVVTGDGFAATLAAVVSSIERKGTP